MKNDEIEKLAILENKRNWEHLFVNDELPKRPYPTHFEQQINGWIDGYKKRMANDKTLITKFMVWLGSSYLVVGKDNDQYLHIEKKVVYTKGQLYDNFIKETGL